MSSIPPLSSELLVSDNTPSINLNKLGEKIYKAYTGRAKKGKTLKYTKKLIGPKQLPRELREVAFEFYIVGYDCKKVEGVNYFTGYDGLAKASLALHPAGADGDNIDELVDSLVEHVQTEYDILNPTASGVTSTGASANSSSASSPAATSTAINTITTTCSTGTITNHTTLRPFGHQSASTFTPLQASADAIDLTLDDTPGAASTALADNAPIAGIPLGGKRLSTVNASNKSSSKRVCRPEHPTKNPVRQSSREPKALRSFCTETSVGRGEVELIIDESQGRNQHSIALDKLSQVETLGQTIFTEYLQPNGWRWSDVDFRGILLRAPGFNRHNGIEGLTLYSYQNLGEAYQRDGRHFFILARAQIAFEVALAKGLVNGKGSVKKCSEEQINAIRTGAIATAKARNDDELKGIADGIKTYRWLSTRGKENKSKWSTMIQGTIQVILAPGIDLAKAVEGVTKYSGFAALNDAFVADGDKGVSIAKRGEAHLPATESGGGRQPAVASSASNMEIDSSAASFRAEEGSSSLIMPANGATSRLPNRVSLSPSLASSASSELSPDGSTDRASLTNQATNSPTSTTSRNTTVSNEFSATGNSIDFGSPTPNHHLSNFVASIKEQTKVEYQAEITRLKEEHNAEIERLKQERQVQKANLEAQLKAQKDMVEQLRSEKEHNTHAGEGEKANDDPVFDGYPGERILRSEVAPPPIKLKTENPVAGELFCPHPKCKAPMILSERGCNVTICMNTRVHGSDFYFCCHCKEKCDSNERANCDCSRRNDMEARKREQMRRNERAGLDPIVIDGDLTGEGHSVDGLKPSAGPS